MSSERQISGSTVLSVSERLIETSQGKLRLPQYQKAPLFKAGMNGSPFGAFGTGFRTINQRSPGFQAGESSQLDEGMVYDLLNKLGLHEVTIDIGSRPMLTERSSKGFLASFGVNGNVIWFVSLGETTAGYEKFPFVLGLALSLNHSFLHEIYELKQEYAHQRWNGPPLKNERIKNKSEEQKRLLWQK